MTSRLRFFQYIKNWSVWDEKQKCFMRRTMEGPKVLQEWDEEKKEWTNVPLHQEEHFS